MHLPPRRLVPPPRRSGRRSQSSPRRRRCSDQLLQHRTAPGRRDSRRRRPQPHSVVIPIARVATTKIITSRTARLAGCISRKRTLRSSCQCPLQSRSEKLDTVEKILCAGVLGSVCDYGLRPAPSWYGPPAGGTTCAGPKLRRGGRLVILSRSLFLHGRSHEN